jgi:citrate lyase subunit beta / citryl-CoA lyase
MIVHPRRSVLFMPGSNPRAHEKAKTLAADTFVFDLEDTVRPQDKNAARDRVAAAIKAGGFRGREIAVKVNDRITPWGKDDMAMIAAVGPDAVLIPKVATPGDIMLAAKDLRDAGAPEHTRLWAMMDTPLAVLNADTILRTAVDPAARFEVVVMGVNELAKETRVRLAPGRMGLLPWLSTCVAAAHAYGLDILDGVFNEIANEKGFRAECEQGRELGMDGKALIHPAQIAICNAVFAPPQEEIAWAAKIIQAFAAPENAAKGVLLLEGRMIERSHEETAQRTVKLAKAIAAMA